MTYAKVAVKNEAGEVERFIIAQDLIEKVLIDEKNNPISYGLEALVDGSELVGLEYYPLFGNLFDNNKDRKSYFSIFGSSKQQPLNNFRVWSADYVSADSGTGVVHIAPSYGEEDFELAKKENIGILHILDDDGIYYDDISRKLYDVMPWKDDTQDLEVWSSNKDIAKGLKKAGIVWKIDYIQHEYPFNPRSKQRIMYRAIPSWFFDIEGQKGLMLEQNENINWFPGHLKHGRFAKNIEAAPDWNLSRDRFWATAMPVWKTESGKIKVVGSYEELKGLSGVELEDYHRPWVDDITFEIDGEKYTRIDKVLDCWFESGSMPFAQFHYPFENKEKFESNFPGDFIVEYVGQVRAWFYYVHTINTALFGENAFKNVITTGVVAGNDGRKMSKSLGNFTDPTELMDQYSADSLRFLLLSSPLLNGEDFALHDKDVSDIARKLSMIWNMYDFFTMYASVDGWEFEGDLKDPSNELQNPLDKWIVSRVHQLRNDVTENMDKYDLPRALEGVLPMVDDASNWFVRRSRRRFWKSENGADKLQAYKTLHYVLSYLALILAPFTPFLSEELWSKLIGGESVHLKDWPEAGVIDEEVLADMAEVRSQVNEALALRAKNSVKIRQPLASATVIKNGKTFDFTPILTEELNIKSVNYGGEETILDLNLTDDLKAEGTSREVIRHIQNSRKKAGLNVDDRIKLNLDFDDDFLAFSIDKFINEISKEVLAEDVKLNQHIEFSYSQSVKVDSQELKISLEKI